MSTKLMLGDSKLRLASTCCRQLTTYHSDDNGDHLLFLLNMKRRPRISRLRRRSSGGQERDFGRDKSVKLAPSNEQVATFSRALKDRLRENRATLNQTHDPPPFSSNNTHHPPLHNNDPSRDRINLASFGPQDRAKEGRRWKLISKQPLESCELLASFCSLLAAINCLIVLISCAPAAQEMVAKLPNSYRLVLGEYPQAQAAQQLVADGLAGVAKASNSTLGGGSLQSYLERRNFGKRLQMNLTEAVLARTLRQLNALNASWPLTTGGPSNVTSATSKLEQLSDWPQMSRRDLLSSLLKYRLLRPGSLLDTWANLTGVRGHNVSQSLRVEASSGSPSDEQRFTLSPSADSPTSGGQSSTGGWLESEESKPVASVLKLPAASNATEAKDYQVVAVVSKAAGQTVSESVAAPVTSPGGPQVFEPLASGPKAQQSAEGAHWQESNIDQVISAKKEAQVKKEGGESEHKHGASAKSASGEHLKDDENSSSWKKQRHGEQQQAGSGKKDAKEGAKFVKDLGHNRHGWKNVYHKEEYAQHQKFHDVFRDKNWDNKKAKLDEKYHYHKGSKFNDTKASDHYDKDKHGTKYDYSKGANWKRYEDDQFDGTSDEAMKEAGKKLEDWELDGPLIQQQQQPDHHSPEQPSEYRASVAPSQSHNQPDGPEDNEPQQHIGTDDAVIEQMRDKLDRLSAQTQQHYSMAPSGADSEQPGQAAGDDYEGDWTSQQPAESAAPSHQSVNEIIKTAKRASNKYQPLQSLGGAGPSEPIIIRNNSTASENHYPDEGDNEGDNEHDDLEKSPPKQNSRKNELRLKLELDLGRSVANRLQGNATRRNQTGQAQSGQQEQALQQQPRGKGESRAAPKHPSNSSWQPRDPDSGLAKVIRDPSRSVQSSRPIEQQNPIREPPPQTSVNSPPKQGSSPASSFQRRPQDESRNRSQHNKAHLSSLAQVLPSRPIFVKHLQMNGGVVLGKLNGFSNNRTVEQQISPMLGEEVTLGRPFGDMITLPGYNQLTVQPQMQQMAEPGREYMLVFGEQPAASGPASQPHLLEDEPNVIFEASAINEAVPTFPASFHELPDLDSLMSEQQGRFSVASDGQIVFSRPNQSKMIAPARQTFTPKPQVTPQDQTAISNLLKLANFNYSSALMNHGPSIGGNIVAPTMQQAISRFLRFPRVFSASQGYKPPYSLKTQESRPTLSFSKLVAESFKPLRGLSVISHRPKHHQQQQQQQQQQMQQQQGQQQQLQHYQQQKQQQVSTGDLLEAASKGVSVTSIQPIMIAAASLPAPMLPPRNQNNESSKFNSGSSQQANPDTEARKKSPKGKKKKKRVKKSGQSQKSEAKIKTKNKPIRFESNLNLASEQSRPVPVQWTAPGADQVVPDPADRAESSMVDHMRYLNQQQQVSWLNPAQISSGGGFAATKMMIDPFDAQEPNVAQAGSRIRPEVQVSSSISVSSPQHISVSTKAPNFGERILKSFKNKLSISGKAPADNYASDNY